MLASGLLLFLLASFENEPWLHPGAKIDFGGAKPIKPQLWFSSADYTSDFERRGEKGEVIFTFDIDTNGRAQRCQPVVSSGFVRLDAWTCKVFLARARFKPARNENGASIPTKGWSRTVWNAPRRPG